MITVESADVKPIRVLMVGDHTDYVKKMVDTLLSHPRLEIVGYAHSGLEAIDAVCSEKPDLVLMDYVMPEMKRWYAKKGQCVISNYH